MTHKFAIPLTAALCIASTALTAQAQPQLSCPLNWSALADIDSPDPNRVILGVKARDWKKEYLDQMLKQEEECMRSSTDPESIKRANLADIQTRAYPNGVRAIEAREQREQQERARAQQVAEENQRRIEAQSQAPSPQPVPATAQREPDKYEQIKIQMAQDAQRHEQFEVERRANQESANRLWIVLGIIIAALGGWSWNKFIRNRCPNCKSTSCETLSVTEGDRWRGTKAVTEKHSRGTNTRHVQTTYVKMIFLYRCKDCQHEWEKQRTEELGGKDSLTRVLSGY